MSGRKDRGDSSGGEFLRPRTWTPNQLRKDIETAVAAFVRERSAEGTKPYEEIFDVAQVEIRRLFAVSKGLRGLDALVLAEHPELVAASRFLGGPPVSADDLKTLVGGSLSGARLDFDRAVKVVSVVRAALDPIRFPWVAEDRDPRQQEMESAINWTAGLWATEQMRTKRRGAASRRQEAAVRLALATAQWQEVPKGQITQIRRPDDLERGFFTRETRVAGVKCDVPVRLLDGRLLALECKVSNTAVNSVKRLNREVGDKAAKWRTAFGDQVVGGAVLSGVYNLTNLEAAQRVGIAVFWEHDLPSLIRFVTGAHD